MGEVVDVGRCWVLLLVPSVPAGSNWPQSSTRSVSHGVQASCQVSTEPALNTWQHARSTTGTAQRLLAYRRASLNLPTKLLAVVHRDPRLPLRRLQQHAPQTEAPKPHVRHALLLRGPAGGSQQRRSGMGCRRGVWQVIEHPRPWLPLLYDLLCSSSLCNPLAQRPCCRPSRLGMCMAAMDPQMQQLQPLHPHTPAHSPLAPLPRSHPPPDPYPPCGEGNDG